LEVGPSWQYQAQLCAQKCRGELVADLGGEDVISTQQSAIIDLAVKSKLILDSIDAWLLTQKMLINKRNRMLFPIVLQRQQLADGLARYRRSSGLNAGTSYRPSPR
jgi:hypothetical protein